MTIPLYQVDAFTDRAFGGNPAAVCLLDSDRPPEWMQAVAGEMKLSETAFLLPPDADDDADWRLRWFTPTVEVDLCGHATLASAHVLWASERHPDGATIRFATRSGPLRASQAGDWIELDFPRQTARGADPPELLIDALGVMPLWVGHDGADFLVEVGDEGAVRELQPDFGLLERVAVRGIMVTARSEEAGIDFVSRFFAPASGVPEDPVTGSAHCTLGPFWAERLGKDELVGYQASGRGGVVRVRVSDQRVLLAGQAVTVFEGRLVLGI